jgi:hypothetical protein
MKYGLTCLVLKLVDKNQFKLSTFFRTINFTILLPTPTLPKIREGVHPTRLIMCFLMMIVRLSDQRK